MNIKLKFDRKVNIRNRSSDRRIFWYAVAAAAASHAVFWSLFNLRMPQRRGAESRLTVTMLSSRDFRAGGQREMFRSWMAYNDPRNFDGGGFGAAATDMALRDVRPAGLREPSDDVASERAAKLETFREVPGRELARRPLVPPPPRDIPEPGVRAGSVVDGRGRTLPLGGVKLPFRTLHTTERTVLRVVRATDTPVLLVERSCGDPELDGFALHSLSFLAQRKPAPEFIVVEWPEEPK